jgi:hypothetical protein
MHLSASDRGMHGSVILLIVGWRNAVGCEQLLLLALYTSTFQMSSEMQVTVLMVTLRDWAIHMSSNFPQADYVDCPVYIIYTVSSWRN